MIQGKVTMQDVARAARVHQTTVSLALRNHPRIPEVTRKRITNVARRMGYRVNPYVAALMSSRHRSSAKFQATLGYVTSDPAETGKASSIWSYQDFYAGFVEKAAELGFAVDHFWLGDPQLTPTRFHQITSTRNIHGLVIAPLGQRKVGLGLDWNRFAAIAYGYSLPEPGIHRVVPDFYHSMLEIVRRCRAAGRSRIGLVLDRAMDRVSEHLWLAALLAEQRIAPAGDRVDPLLLSAWDVVRFRAWVRRHKPQVIVAVGSTLDQIRALSETYPAPLITLNGGSDNAGENYEGVILPRRLAGHICAAFLIGQLQRNERGPVTVARTTLVQTDWFDPRPVKALV